MTVEHLGRIRNGSNDPTTYLVQTINELHPSNTCVEHTLFTPNSKQYTIYMMQHGTVPIVAVRRCPRENMMRGRNHRSGGNHRTLDFALVVLIFLISSSVVVALLGNRSTFQCAVAAWTTVSTGRTTLRRMPSHQKKVAFLDRGKKRLDTSHRCSPLPASNINGNHIEDAAPPSPLSLLPQLPTPFIPSSSCKVDQMSGTDLAYIGDVVYELFIRTRTVWPLKRTSDLQHQVVALVRGTIHSICYPITIISLRSDTRLANASLCFFSLTANSITT